MGRSVRATVKKRESGKPHRGAAPGLALAMTGASSTAGGIVLRQLLETPGIGRILALDLDAPQLNHPKLIHAKVDFTHPSAADELAAHLRARSIESIVHMAFFARRSLDPSYLRDVEVGGTRHLLQAARASSIRRIVMASNTNLYGAAPSNPALITEDRTLPPWTEGALACRAEAERQLLEASQREPRLRALILRFAPTLGPASRNEVTRYLERSYVPMLLGFDPMVQALHEEDMAHAFALALFADAQGVFNVVGRGALPLSHAIRAAGSTPLPLPRALARAALAALAWGGLTSLSPTALDSLRYPWVADGDAAKARLGFIPRYSTREALEGFANAKRHAKQ